MPLDTKVERFGMANWGKPVPVFLPDPDGEIDWRDRVVMLPAYPLDTVTPADFGITIGVYPAVPIRNVCISTSVPLTVGVSPP